MARPLRTSIECKSIYEVSDIINLQLGHRGIEFDTVVGRDSIEYFIEHKGRRIRFFMQYDD